MNMTLHTRRLGRGLLALALLGLLAPLAAPVQARSTDTRDVEAKVSVNPPAATGVMARSATDVKMKKVDDDERAAAAPGIKKTGVKMTRVVHERARAATGIKKAHLKTTHIKMRKVGHERAAAAPGGGAPASMGVKMKIRQDD